MKFCNVCNNMLYIKVDNDQLQYFCKNCEFTTADETTSSVCVMENVLDENVTNVKQYSTPFIKYDPTLPRVNNIKCPNSKCTKEGAAQNEVIYIKFNPIKMSYLYYCCYCEHFWKSEKDS
jgi:DNA-directed RNA polymerase subunit M/transcription elongation factor TFIIS